MAFYGAIEQLLTGWIFGLLPQDDEQFEQAKWLVLETVCGGLEANAASGSEAGRSARRRGAEPPPITLRSVDRRGD
jgi:hypothetical protein